LRSRTVECAIEDAEDVGGRAANIHAYYVDALPAGDRLKDVANRARRCMIARLSIVKLVVPRVSHDVFEEQIVNGVARRAKVFALQDRRNYPLS